MSPIVTGETATGPADEQSTAPAVKIPSVSGFDGELGDELSVATSKNAAWPTKGPVAELMVPEMIAWLPATDRHFTCPTNVPSAGPVGCVGSPLAHGKRVTLMLPDAAPMSPDAEPPTRAHLPAETDGRASLMETLCDTACAGVTSPSPVSTAIAMAPMRMRFT